MIELVTPKIAAPYLRLVCDYCGYSTGKNVDQTGGADGIRRRHSKKFSSNSGRRRIWPIVHKTEKGYWSEDRKGFDICSEYCKERYEQQGRS